MGAPFGAQAFDVCPDIMTMAKAITNGVVPLGAVASRDHIYDTIVDASPTGAIEFFHGYTYSAIPVSMAAGLAMQDIIEKENLFERAKDMSPYFLDGLFSLKDLDIIIKEIDQSDIRLPVTKIIKNNYQKLIKLGFAKEDTSNLIRLLM